MVSTGTDLTGGVTGPLEAAALIASVAYYLGAPATPALAVMIAMPALMLVFVPVTDPDAAERREVD